ncbi:hypothetical protein D3Z38_05820 [Clostridiales bacterium]|nr:hypothetical protein [Clostridiales bacterium]
MVTFLLTAHQNKGYLRKESMKQEGMGSDQSVKHVFAHSCSLRILFVSKKNYASFHLSSFLISFAL